MSESIGSLLPQRELFEPPEIKIVKEFVEQKFHVTPGVQISETQINVLVQSAGLAGALRPYTMHIQKACNTTKRIVIRIRN